MRKQYNKLVRDNTAAIIHRHGDTCQTEIMTEGEFQLALRHKVVEEAQEVMQATTDADFLKELADLYEVIDTLLDTNNISIDMLRMEQGRRRVKRGGFTQRIKLLWTE